MFSACYEFEDTKVSEDVINGVKRLKDIVASRKFTKEAVKRPVLQVNDDNIFYFV